MDSFTDVYENVPKNVSGRERNTSSSSLRNDKETSNKSKITRFLVIFITPTKHCWDLEIQGKYFCATADSVSKLSRSYACCKSSTNWLIFN